MGEEKYIDESWKESVAQEKEKFKKNEPSDGTGQKPTGSTAQGQPSKTQENYAEQTDADFVNYISSLVYQAMFFLGEIPNPVDNKVEINVEQAKFVIDTLIMLRSKTKGNLSKQENDMLNTAIYELQMKYVELTQKQPKPR